MPKRKNIFDTAPTISQLPVAKGKVKKLIARAFEIQLAMEAMRPLYGELDAIITELVSKGMEPTRVGGRTAMLIDNFAAKNVAFKTVAQRRWDLRVS